MPKPCLHFRLLSKRLNDLQVNFVSDQIQDEAANPATFQPDLDRLAAFRLLIHAEIEDFLEAKARENVQSVRSRIGSGSTWMREAPEMFPLAIALKSGLPQDDTLDLQCHANVATELMSAASKFISDNNGVKTHAFATLSLCAGKTLDEIDLVLSAGLNSFGRDRGDVAHKSVTRCSSLQAPSAELQTARSLVDQIGRYFDVVPFLPTI